MSGRIMRSPAATRSECHANQRPDAAIAGWGLWNGLPDPAFGAYAASSLLR